jgi:hypothetical protein
MDLQQFSAWKRALSQVPSRRDVLRGLAGASLGLGAMHPRDAEAAKTRKNGKTRKGKGKGKGKDTNQNNGNGNNDSGNGTNDNGGGNGQNPTSPPPPTPPPPPPTSPPPPPPVCKPTCSATKPCGPNGCGGTCGACTGNDTCQNGTCVCVPTCASTNPCGPDGCGGTCGACAGPTCQGATLTTQVCAAGTCQPVVTSCAAGQVCFQNACCTREPEPTCHKQSLSDGCGGAYPPNCGQQQHCCEELDGELICRSLPCP